MNNVKTVTLGCRLNFNEAEVAKTMVEHCTNEKVVIINTCCVTKEAERQSKQAVRKAIKENPNAKIIVTGCATKTSSDYFEKLENIHVVQNDVKIDFESYKKIFGLENENIDTKYENIHMFEGKIRAFLQIQNGCNHFCTYCIIPHTRGRSRSMDIENIDSQLGYFVDHGFSEIVLSGIDITEYGSDLNPKQELADVIEHILNKFPKMNRIRISSIDPSEISDRLFNLFASEEKIMPHFHISSQSGDNQVLKHMRRRHAREDVIEFCNNLRAKRPSVVFGSDFIVGFPTETEEMFENTVKLVKEAGISLLHVFPYSPRPGTPAATMIQLPKNVIQSRAKILRDVGDQEKLKLMNSVIGQDLEFVIEKSINGISTGKTNNFIPISIDKELEIGYISTGKATYVDGDYLRLSL